jgi:hypothetical protein
MNEYEDKRAEHLGWVESALRRQQPDLVHLRLVAQSHYGPPDALAFVEVYGLDADRTRRRAIRAEAGDLLRRLGYRVEVEPGRDVFDITPVRPRSAHEELHMLQRLRKACSAETED